MKTVSIGNDFDVYEETGDGITDGEWTCHKCPYQNEVDKANPVSFGDVVECEICCTEYKVV